MAIQLHDAARACSLYGIFKDAILIVRLKAVGLLPLVDVVLQKLQIGVITADNGKTVEGDFVQKIDERFL